MDSQRGLFASGLVLGLGIGLILGHFFRQSPVSNAPLMQVSPERVAFNLPVEAASIETHSLLSHPDSMELELDETSDDFLSGPGPLRNALAMEPSHETLRPATNQAAPQTLSKEIKPDRSEEPGQLTISDASPLAQNSPRDQQIIRGIIDIELKHLPQDKQQVWFEALKDVNKEDVAGILRMWKLLGGPIPEAPMGTMPSLPMAATPEAVPFDHPALSENADSINGHNSPSPHGKASGQQAAKLASLFEQADQVLQENLILARTPGYIMRIPEFRKSASGEMTLEIRADFNSLRQVETGFPLDLVIQGRGFFVVTSPNGKRYFTRGSHFMLNDKRQLSLRTGSGQLLSLFPEIVIPKRDFAANSLHISPEGTVSILTPSPNHGESPAASEVIGEIEVALPWQSQDLESSGDGLFALSLGKEDCWQRVSLSSNETHIRTGYLEMPEPFPIEVMKDLQQLRQQIMR